VPRSAWLPAVVLALCSIAGCSGGSTGAGARFPKAPLVLISIDTLRSDHLPAYGYKGVDTPHIDSLRRDAILFETAYSHCPLTLPSHVSILTGLLPPDHGVRDNLGYTLDAGAHPTLAGILHSRGYATGAAVSAYVLRGKTGLFAGFDWYDDAIDVPARSESAALAQRSGLETEKHALDWEKTAHGQPFFLFFHIYEPHLPYDPPEPFKSRYPLAYDGEIAQADAIVGGLLDALKRDGTYDRAVVVLLSDHGEGLGEHGEADHGILLYREALQVPLLVKLPSSRSGGTSVARAVELVDVLPTVLGLLDVPVPAGVRGASLLAPVAAPVSIYSETYYPRIHLGWSELRSLVSQGYHLIDGPGPELYALATDAGEKQNLLPAREPLAAGMRSALGGFAAAFSAPRAPDAEAMEKLRSLGYLGGAAPPADAAHLPDPKTHIHALEDVKAGFRLAAAGRNLEALAVFDRLLAENPNIVDVRFKRGEVLHALGRDDEALEAYKAVLQVSPSLSEGLAIPMAEVNLQLGHLDAADASARLAVPGSPSRAHETLARIALARDDLDAALREASALKADPGTAAEASVIEAEVLIRRNAPEKALALLDAAAPRSAPIENFQFLRGDCLARLNRLGDAEAAFREEIRLFPANSQAYSRLAVVLGLRGRTVREVESLLEAMMAASPGPATALIAAKTLESMGDRAGGAAWRHRAASLGR
jgi:choline-sulfatase